MKYIYLIIILFFGNYTFYSQDRTDVSKITKPKNKITYIKETMEPVNGYVSAKYESGNLKSQVKYLNGKKNGIEITYRDNHLKTILSKEPYQNGDKNGLCEIFNDDGRLIITTEYKNDMYQGAFKCYDPKDGEITQIRYYNENKLIINGTLKNAIRLYEDNELFLVVLDIKKDHISFCYKNNESKKWTTYIFFPDNSLHHYSVSDPENKMVPVVSDLLSFGLKIIETFPSRKSFLESLISYKILYFKDLKDQNIDYIDFSEIPIFETHKNFSIEQITNYDDQNLNQDWLSNNPNCDNCRYIMRFEFINEKNSLTLQFQNNKTNYSETGYWASLFNNFKYDGTTLLKNNTELISTYRNKLLKIDKVSDKILVGYNKSALSVYDFELPIEELYIYKGNFRSKGSILISQELGFELEKTTNSQNSYDISKDWKGNGSGFFISKNGYLATNYHVIKDAKEIEIEYKKNDRYVKYKAEIVIADKKTDIAILKVNDLKFTPFNLIPYNFKLSLSDLGTEVFALGYPMALNFMGKEIKFTDGRISSQTGFQDDPTTYQTTTPIQGGNSGGPLFDHFGNIIGINSSGLDKSISDNVSYSIKINYLKNLMSLLPEEIDLPESKWISTKTLVEQIKILKNYVVLIKVK